MSLYAFEQLILDCSWSLLGEIVPEIRSIAIRLEKKNVMITFFYDGDMSTRVLEDLDSITLELSNRCPSDYTIETNRVRLDWPKPLPDEGTLVYLRKEADTYGA